MRNKEDSNLVSENPQADDQQDGQLQQIEQQMEEAGDSIINYESSHPIYSLAFCNNRSNSTLRLALGSHMLQNENKITILRLSENETSLTKEQEFVHEFPPTNIQWVPQEAAALNSDLDLLATSGEFLKLWQLKDPSNSEEPESFDFKNKSDYSSPITSFDWNKRDHNLIGTASLDTTCTIWDIAQQTVRTQLIAHNKAVYDICFANEQSVFASAGEDGSVRQFDLRDLERSTIIYETDNPIVRIAWNQNDPNQIAALIQESNQAVILDIRQPMTPVLVLSDHQAAINSISWHPEQARTICTAGDDSRALIWDLSNMEHVTEPCLCYTAQSEIYNLSWCSVLSDWMAIAFDNKVQCLKT